MQIVCLWEATLPFLKSNMDFQHAGVFQKVSRFKGREKDIPASDHYRSNCKDEVTDAHASVKCCVSHHQSTHLCFLHENCAQMWIDDMACSFWDTFSIALLFGHSLGCFMRNSI